MITFEKLNLFYGDTTLMFVCETKNRTEIESPSQSICTLHQASRGVYYKNINTSIEISYFILFMQKCLFRQLFFYLR